jgi:hypothetical protein
VGYCKSNMRNNLWCTYWYENKVQWYLGIRPLWSPTWYRSCLEAKNFAWYMTFVWNTTHVLELVWVKMSPDTACYSPPQHQISKHSTLLSKVKRGYLFHLIAFLFIYFSIKQCLNYLYNPIK